MDVFKRQQQETRQLKSKDGLVNYSLSSVITNDLSGQFFVHHEILAPGLSTAAPHYHQQTEEFVYVLEGRVEVLEGLSSEILVKGDSVRFNIDSEQKHCVRNTFKEPAELLIVKQNIESSDVVF